MSRVYLRATIIAIAVALCTLAAGQASAQDRRQSEPGNFDFYLLTLSWSPSFCDASAERAAQANSDDRGRAPARAEQTAVEAAGDQPRRNARRGSRNEQCGDRPYSFVVHGLWPQYE